MKTKTKFNFCFGWKFISILLYICCSLEICYAQWQPDFRLTNNSDSSRTSNNNAWCIASNGNIVHTVWYDKRDGNYEIYYNRSTDEGVSWGADARLTNNSGVSIYPSVSVSDLVVQVAWQDNSDGNTEIYYKRSTDAGISWGTDIRLTNNTGQSNTPSMCVSGQVVHIVWSENRDGNFEIYYKHSTDAGINWGADTRITNNSSQSSSPSISASGQVVHIVWNDNRDGNYEIYHNRSTDGGISWGTDTRITNDPAISQTPSIAVTGSNVHVAWFDSRSSNGAFYKHSTDGGVSWGTDTMLRSNPSGLFPPSVAVSGQVVHIVWSHNPLMSNHEIFYKRSLNGGVSWEAETRLTNEPPGQSLFPSVAVSGQAVHVIWNDNRDGNYEIYYKRNPTGNFVGLKNINYEVPKEFSLYQNYPNPFNPTTHLRFEIAELKFVKLIIYDILGRAVTTLVNYELNAGDYEIEFDGSYLSSGVYYYKLNAGNYEETKKMILIK